MKRSCILGAALGFTVAACLPVHAIVLRYEPKVGTVTKYKASMAGRMHTSMAGMDEPMQMEMTTSMEYTEKVLAKTEKGTKVETKLVSGEGQVNFDGQSQTIPIPTGRMVAELDARGRLIELIETDLGDDAAMQQVMGVGGENFPNWPQFGTFPEGDVEEGQSWTGKLSIPVPGGGTGMELTVKSRLLALTTFQDRKCAKVRSSFSGPMNLDMSAAGLPAEEDVEGSMEANIEGDMLWYYDYENSIYVYGEGTVGMDMAFSMPEGMGGDMTSKMALNVKTGIAR